MRALCSGGWLTLRRVSRLTKSASTDLKISGRLVDAPIWYDATWPEDEYKRRYVGNLRHVGQPLNLRKTGSGTLLLNNISSTTTGRIEFAEGVLKLGKRGNSQDPATKSALGNLAISNRVALVLSGGTLEFTASDTLGQASCVNFATFVVSNATLRSMNESGKETGWANSLPFLELYDAKFEMNGGLATGDDPGPYGTFIFTQRVKWDGTRPYDIQPNGKGNCFALNYANDFYAEPRAGTSLTNWHGKGEFWVADITKDARPDVTIGVVLKDQATWTGGSRYGKTIRFRCGLLKTGPGTLCLNGTGIVPGLSDNRYYTEATRVNGGTLLIDSQAFQSTNIFVQAGAWLGGTGTVKRATIEVGGGFTAAPGQTRALNLQAVELPADKVVRLDVPCTEDLETVTALRVPVVNAAGLVEAKWTCTVNGAPAPTGYSARAVVSGGVVYASLAKSGMVLIIR